MKGIIGRGNGSVSPFIIRDKAVPVLDKSISTKKVFSEMILVEINCVEDQVRVKEISYLSKHKGEGDVIGLNKGPFEWESIEKGSTYSGLKTGLCSHLYK